MPTTIVTPPPPARILLARAAYAAYSQSTGGLNYQGLPMPDWDGLGETIQGAWRAATGTVRETVLAERALAVAWSQWDESVPPRDRIRQDMKELTEVADPEHRARRSVRTTQDLDAYRDVILQEAAAAARSRKLPYRTRIERDQLYDEGVEDAVKAVEELRGGDGA